jgi:hypothetical protein
MYARCSTFSVSANRGPDALRAFADAVGVVMRGQPGFRCVVFYGDDVEQHSVSVWDTREQAESVGAAIAAWLEDVGWDTYTGMMRTPVSRIVPAYMPLAGDATPSQG